MVRLPGLGSAGYAWEYAVDGLDGTVEVAPATSADSADLAAPGGPPPGNSNQAAQFTVSARAPGHVLVRFALRRPWEKGVPPLAEYVLEVLVRA